MLPRDHIHRIRYFTALVSARPSDPQQPQRQQLYLRALGTLPNVSVHLGHYLTSTVRMPLAHPLANGPLTVAVLKTEEKGSDVNLATYLLLDAFRHDCDAAVVISNDSDLAEPIRVAEVELGIKVGIVNPHPANRRSRALHSTFFKQLRPNALATSQFAAQLTDQRGTFHKPPRWN
ncbi:MAG: NYN domain-containing protein [Acidimicrobiia bacterium]|nr:NYN domain-containing protein [Acidimicrobiia bacterium]